MDSRFAVKFISGRPHFQRLFNIARDDIYRVRAHGDLSNRGDKSFGVPSMAFNCNRHFRGTGKGVGAKRHWYRAGMARLATQCQSVTLNAANGCNEANRMVISLKDWPLFNMRFHIADNRTISSNKLGMASGSRPKSVIACQI